MVGDVTGHGQRAASYRVELVERLASLTHQTNGPAALLRRLNDEIEGVWPTDIFACLVCIDIHLGGTSATIAVAGHLPPLLKTARQARVISTERGAPVGSFAGELYLETEIRLPREAVLVVATDGIGDALMTAVDPLGLGALERSIAKAPRDPDDLCAFVFDSAARLGLRDDATVMALKISPAHAQRLSHAGEARLVL